MLTFPWTLNLDFRELKPGFELGVNGILQSPLLCGWPFSFSTVRSTHATEWTPGLLLLLSKWDYLALLRGTWLILLWLL